MRKSAICLALCGHLAGCDTPGPAFRGIDPVRVAIAASTFDVRVDGRRAEAIRLGAEWAPQPEAVAPRGVAAIEAVSGCRVRRLRGDAAMMVADLDCGGDLPPLPDPRLRYLECGPFETRGSHTEFVCDPVY